MEIKKPRLMKADEIDVRVGTVKDKGLSLLLYKDARADMNILDEWVGPTNWTRSHEMINGNLFSTVGIYDQDKKQWVYKQDVGTESKAEKEKGQSSDSFKRACVNWGIGRELYTAPFIWVTITNKEVEKYTKFKVFDIGYNEDRVINKLIIKDEKGLVRYTYGNTKTTDKAISKPKAPNKTVEAVDKEPYTKTPPTKTTPEVYSKTLAKAARSVLFKAAYQKGVDRPEVLNLWEQTFSDKADSLDLKQIEAISKIIDDMDEFDGTPL